MTAFEELGTPVRSVNWVRVHAGRSPSGEDRVWATMGQQAAGFFVLDIDPETGSCVQVGTSVPSANYPTATCASQSGVLYVGVAYYGHLFSYDGTELRDLGAINPEKATFPCRIDEDADGKLWIGSYGGADLTCYDPATETFERYGSRDDEDMYCYPMVDHASGRIACLIKVINQHVVLFDPKTGNQMTVGPSMTKEEGVLDLVRGADDRLYITAGEKTWKIEGDAVEDVASVEVPPATLSDGSRFEFADADTFLYQNLLITAKDATRRTVPVQYEAAGSEIFMLHEGPDRRIYGSSILPLHFFAHDPTSGETVDYGKASESGGEAYSMANHDGHVYISSYPAARISVYDPERAYEYGVGGDANPLELGRIDDVSYRPRTTLAGPLGRIWTASLPDYGMWGGPLAWYDPRSSDRGSYRDVAGEGSCYTLAHLEADGLIAIGTTINAGTGTQPRENEAKLILWDYERERPAWEGRPVEGLTTINALTVVSSHIYGTAVGEDTRLLFKFDPATRSFEIVSTELPGRPLDHGLRLDGDQLYGVTDSAVYAVSPSGIQVVPTEDGLFEVAGPIQDGVLYFATNHRLRRLRLS